MSYKKKLVQFVRLVLVFTWLGSGLSKCIANEVSEIGRGDQVFRDKKTVTLEFFEAHFGSVPKQRKGILIILDNETAPGKILKEKKWVEFSKLESLALVSISFRIRDGIRDRGAVSEELMALVNSSVADRFGQGVKKIIFGRGVGGEMFLRAMNNCPDCIFWTVVGASYYPIVGSGKTWGKVSPGLIICTRKSQFGDAQEFFRAIRRSNVNRQRVTFVGSDTSSLDESFLNRFFRQFLSSLFSGKIDGGGHWCLNFGHEGPPKDEQRVSVDFSWLPNEEMVGAWRMLNLAQGRLPRPAISMVTFKTPAGPQNLWISAPVGQKEETVRAVLLWMTSANDDSDMKVKLRDLGHPLIRFAEENQIPVFAWNGSNVWPHQFHQSSKNATDLMVAETDSDFVKVGDAMFGRIRELCRERGWPDRGWLLEADGKMGRYGVMMARAYQFLAVHLHSASGLKDVDAAPDEPWLVTFGWGDDSAIEGGLFGEESSKKYWPIIRKRFPNMGHDGSRWDVRVLTREFFSYAVWLIEGDGATQVRATIRRRELNSDSSLLNPSTQGQSDSILEQAGLISVGEWFSKALQTPYLVGDLRRVELVETSVLQNIPIERRVRLPTRKIAEAWEATAAAPPGLTKEERGVGAENIDSLSTPVELEP